MTPFYYFSLALWATSVTGASFSKRADSSFGLYAYGDVIGGLPVFYANSSAFVVDQQMAGNAFTSAVFTDANSTWIANPNTTATNSNGTFSNTTFFVNPLTHGVGFPADNGTAAAGDITSGFMFYGRVALLVDSSGDWVSMFYALATETSGIWSLNWNSTGVANAIPLTLKSTPPSNDASADNSTTTSA